MTLNLAYAGARFGNAVVTGGKVKPTSRGHSRVECKCDCGTVFSTRRSWLISGRVTRCGLDRRHARLDAK